MSGRSIPEPIDEARRAAIRSRLVGSGASDETADAWIAAWETKAAEDGLERGQAYWQAGWDWMAVEREHRVKPWGTWHERKQAEEASEWSWREIFSGGALLVAMGLALTIGVIGVLVAMTVGINVLARWMVDLLTKPPLPALIGAGAIVFAGWVLLRIATGHSRPGTSRRDKMIAALVLIILALIGAGFLTAAIAPQAQDSPGF